MTWALHYPQSKYSDRTPRGLLISEITRETENSFYHLTGLKKGGWGVSRDAPEEKRCDASNLVARFERKEFAEALRNELVLVYDRASAAVSDANAGKSAAERAAEPALQEARETAAKAYAAAVRPAREALRTAQNARRDAVIAAAAAFSEKAPA